MPGGEPPWCRKTKSGVALDVWIQPGAARSEVAGIHDGRLKLRIAAPPTEGRANAEVVRFLATRLAVPKSTITISRGRSTRRKLVTIEEIDLSRILRLVGSVTE